MNLTAWLEAAQQFHSQQRAYALVTVLRVTPPASARAGDKAVVTADGTLRGWIGGGCAQPAVIKAARLALADGQPRTIRITPASESEEKQLEDVLEFGMSCHSGGTLELFVDPVLPQEALVVFGDSPVARALCDLAPRVGFAVHWVAQGAVATDAPAAHRVLDNDDAASVTATVPPASWVVVATQGRRDMPALKAALQIRARRIWFVASERKAGVLKDSLLAAGEDADRVGAIVAPAGTPIGADTPEEIALSVLASVVAARRQQVNDAASPKSCCGGRKPAAAQATAAARVSEEATAVTAGATLTEAAMEAATAMPEPSTPAASTQQAKTSCCGG
ncbi:XdhC family protein [Tepidicella baoligensis]|uniref:XdhC family protein n=1 Tax=Tepidicella baoligensis TaxID=2707016 RepID=UPI0015DAF626|nr:XdhC family protein [Tepidicella baoligensis]